MLAYHYTTAYNFHRIRQTGLLKSRALLLLEKLHKKHGINSIADGEALLPDYRYRNQKSSWLHHKPMIWFSLNQHWESQAGDMNPEKDSGRTEHLSMRQTYTQGAGLVRFGMAEDRLLNWERFMREAGIRSRYRITVGILDACLSGSYESRNVMGVVAAAIPLTEMDAIETFRPDAASLTDAENPMIKGEWKPTALSIPAVTQPRYDLQSLQL
jgi:hypothetical protein